MYKSSSPPLPDILKGRIGGHVSAQGDNLKRLLKEIKEKAVEKSEEIREALDKHDNKEDK